MPDDTALVPAVRQEVVNAALEGLLQPRKTLPAKLFYDEAGSRLFAEITELPEYYLTRTERALLEMVAPRVAELLTAHVALIEYGASDEAKAEFLLGQRNAAGTPVIQVYVPIDVAAAGLQRMQERLHRSRPYLRVCPVVADFTKALNLPRETSGLAPLGFFPGSTIGNLDPFAADRFLRQARRTLGTSAHFLIGVDLRKDPDILLPAYNDAAGITAAFNRNLLERLNREAGADFDVAAFEHRAVWNDAESRIEMHLVSRRDQEVRLDGQTILFAAGETIHTENSYKYTPEAFAALASAAGWRAADLWIDRDGLFSIHMFVS
jgi:dimethylhistidine N-methyltransferase